MKKVSDKRKILDAEYREKRIAFLTLNPYCAVCGGMATDVHHKARRGVNYLNVLTWLPICRKDHIYLETHGKWARENGYLL